jgi:hypothetical protein
VDCTKILTRLPAYCPRWTLRAGIEELHGAYRAHGLEQRDLEGSRYLRVRRVLELIACGRLGEDLRWKDPELARAGVRR